MLRSRIAHIIRAVGWPVFAARSTPLKTNNNNQDFAHENVPYTQQRNLRTLDPDVQQTLQAAPPTGIATFAAGKQTALTFSTRLRDALHLGNHNSFRKLQENTDTNGKQHSRYRQYYAGVPLYGEQVLI